MRRWLGATTPADAYWLELNQTLTGFWVLLMQSVGGYANPCPQWWEVINDWTYSEWPADFNYPPLYWEEKS